MTGATSPEESLQTGRRTTRVEPGEQPGLVPSLPPSLSDIVTAASAEVLERDLTFTAKGRNPSSGDHMACEEEGGDVAMTVREHVSRHY